MLNPVPVVTNYAESLSVWDRTIVAETDTPTHLFLAYTTPKPITHPRYRTRRGVLQQCGFWLSAPNAECFEQAELGDTLTHTFAFVPTQPRPSSYAILTDACSLETASWSTVPIRTESTTLQPFFVVDAQNVQTIAVGATWVRPWTIFPFNIGWPLPALPFTQIAAPYSGQVLSFQQHYVTPSALGSCTFTVRDATTNTPILQTLLTFPDLAQRNYQSFGYANVIRAHLYQAEITNHGPGTIFISGSFVLGTLGLWEMGLQ